MDIRKIKKLIDLMIESDLQAIEVKEGDQLFIDYGYDPVEIRKSYIEAGIVKD